MPFAAINGNLLFYRLEGNDNCPVLVLVHSLGVDNNLWDREVQSLLSRYRVLRYDLRGHGASDAPPGDYTIEMLGRDLLGLVDSLSIQRFAFCGISIGGFIGQWLGAHAGDRLRGLVLANTSPNAGPASNWDTRRQTVLTGGMKAIADAFVERSFLAETVARSEPRVATLRRTFLGTKPAGYAGCCAAIREMDQTALLEKIRLPTLVISGDKDIPLPWESHGAVLAREIPEARSVLLPAGHLSNIDRPELFLAALTDFLGTLPA